jgi:poly-gamma-glutamate synthesis protein (capsule biosynthesis protein)
MTGIFNRCRLLACFLSIFLVYFLSSCRDPEFFVIIQEDSNFADEKVWLENALGSSPEFEALGLRLGSGDVNAQNAVEIHIEFFSSWNFEDKPDGIPVSKTWLVPQDNALAGRMDTSLERCLEEKESLVTLDGLFPPFAALRVDGYAAGDDRYPLIRLVGIRFKFDENNKYGAEKAAPLEKLLLELPKPLMHEKPVLTWISSAGDMMLGRNAGNILLNQGPGALLGATAEIFLQSDLAMLNLEGPLSSRGRPAQKTFTFRFEPPRALAAAVKSAGIGAVLFANNHAFDYGEEAFLDTINFLEEAGIAFLGVGRNEAEALSPFIFEKDGFSANVWGLASFPRESTGWDGLGHVAAQDKAGFLHAGRGGAEKLKLRIREQGGKESLNIVLFHGGAEWSHRPNAATRELYTGLVSEGADLIIGSHPHIVQGFEWIGDKLIFWSLGNFVFSGMEDTGGGDEGLLIRLGYWGKKPVYIEPFAVDLSGPRVELAPSQKLEDFYRKSSVLYNNTEH